jgi:hypothetical protein
LLYLGDNCIVFENFTASIGDLMMANCVYWQVILVEKTGVPGENYQPIASH